MRRIGFKFLIIVLISGLVFSCKTKKQYAKHRPPSTKKSRDKKENSKTESSSSSSSKTSPKAAKTIQTARSYTGVKYKYGGTTKSGMDCSGLMCTSFKSVGVNLPRTSSAQSTIGKRIYIGELQPGDLIFFATGSNKAKITHVGLITEVKKANSDVRFIHASTSKGVREDNVFDTYWRPRYVKAVRVL